MFTKILKLFSATKKVFLCLLATSLHPEKVGLCPELSPRKLEEYINDHRLNTSTIPKLWHKFHN